MSSRLAWATQQDLDSKVARVRDELSLVCARCWV